MLERLALESLARGRPRRKGQDHPHLRDIVTGGIKLNEKQDGHCWVDGSAAV
jgi:hypothetical protein